MTVTWPAAAAAQVRAGVASSLGAISVTGAPAALGMHEQGEPLERHGEVAGEIAQLGAHPDQEGVEPGRPGSRSGAFEPLGEPFGGDGAAHPTGSWAASSVEIQAASTRSPCSNSARYA